MKKTICVFLLAFVFLGIAQAQETKYIFGGAARQLALGGSPTNAYLMDYTDVNTNPAWAVKYSDFIYGELGYNFAAYNASGQVMGFTYAIWKGLSVGLSVGKQEGPVFGINSYGAGFGGATADADNMIGGINTLFNATPFTSPFNATTTQNVRPLQVYGALKLANLTVGLAIYRSSWSSTNDRIIFPDTKNTKDEESIVQTGFKAGALFDMNVMLLDVSALLRINSVKAKTTPPPPVPPATLTGNSELKATGTEIALNARLFMKLSDKFTLVPMARFSTFGYEPEVVVAIPSLLIPAGNKLNAKPNKYGRTDIEFGVGTNVTVPGGRIFAGLSLESIALKNDYSTFRSPANAGDLTAPDTSVLQTTKNSTSVLSLPKVTLGAEFDIASWLTGRLGYFKAFAGRKITTEAPGIPTAEQTGTFDFAYCPSFGTTSADQLLSVGLGIHFDRLSFDGYLSERWLAYGPYIASGQAQAMFGVLSMSYSFQ